MLKLLRKWLQAGVMVEWVRVQRTVAGTPQGGVISPLLANIYLHVLDTELSARGVGELVRATPMMVWCCADRRRRRVRPWKRWETSWRRWGCDCIRTRRRWSTCVMGARAWIFWVVISGRACRGRLWEQRGIVRYYLHRWPSQTAMARLRARP